MYIPVWCTISVVNIYIYTHVYCDVHFYFALHIDTNMYRVLKHVLSFYSIAQVMFAPSVHRQQMSLFRSISDAGG